MISIKVLYLPQNCIPPQNKFYGYVPEQNNNNNNNNNNNYNNNITTMIVIDTTMVYGADILAQPLREFTQFI